ncbi:OLC1v1035839C1 [Oldenlandia corymbosa var. corymbosa]|uniref:OLC1v1035839C1 n=1 Tax=Oldenlandia corymbosa var. corymbosa TaxID=529605 RepID=A0AAV1CTY7_OLDCO|nr:OLC1v1035839C1 [Oldenlandia corymbosa var. corymbosa]
MMNDPTLIHHLEMKPSAQDYQPQNYQYFPSTNELSTSSSEPYEQRNDFDNVSPPSTLTFGSTGRNVETLCKMPSSSCTPPISIPFISFSNSRSTDVKTGAENKVGMSQMINFGCVEPTSSEGSIEYGQPTKKSGRFTRTPTQAKYHMMAERKRREKLVQQFISLSALVPGLPKMNKISIMDGAIDHMKQLKNRLKTLTDWDNHRMKHDEQQDLSCSSQTEQIIRTSIDHSWNDIQLKVEKPNVLIRVTCEDRTILHEEDFVREMNNLNLSVTNSRFMPFGDNKLVLSALAKMKEGFCMTDEEIEDSIRLSILKLIIT